MKTDVFSHASLIDQAQPRAATGSHDLVSEILTSRKQVIKDDIQSVAATTFSQEELEILSCIQPGTERVVDLLTDSESLNAVRFSEKWHYDETGTVIIEHSNNDNEGAPFMTIHVAREYAGGRVYLHIIRNCYGMKLCSLGISATNEDMYNASAVIHFDDEGVMDCDVYGHSHKLTAQRIYQAFGGLDVYKMHEDKDYREAQYKKFRNELIG